MLVPSLDLATLLVAGLMVGNEFAIAAFIDPALKRLGTDTEAAASQVVARLLGTAMPFWYALTFLLTSVLTWMHWHSPGRPWLVAAAGAWAVIIVFTILFLVPLNNRVAGRPPTLSLEDVQKAHRTWSTLHRLRVIALAAALLCLLHGVLISAPRSLARSPELHSPAEPAGSAAP